MPVVYNPAPPPAVVERKQPEVSTPWPPPEEHTGKPMWLVGLLAFAGVLALLGIAWFVMSSHGSSQKDSAAAQKPASPLQKDLEVVGIRIVSGNGGQAVKFLLVNHSGVELSDVAGKVTLWASTSRSDDDAVGSFTLHADSVGPNESKELSAPLKSDKPAYDQPDWRNITADLQITSPQ
jgi:hypothetical protein